MIYNHIPVKIGCLPKVTAAPINFQYDQVQVLQIEGIELPTSYRVDFCNPGDAATITMVGTADGVQIPNQLLATGLPVIAYVVLTGTDENAVETRYQITIPVNKRPPASDIQPTPAEQSTIDSLIEAMNDAVDAAEDAQTAAELAQDGAETAETGAEAQALKAEGYAVGTQDGTPVSSDSPYYENNAEYMKDAAAQYAFAADTAEGEAAAWATGSYSGNPSGIPVPDDAPQHNNNAHYYKEQAAASAAAAEAALEQFTTPTASASTLPAGSSATASYNNGNFAFGIPKGDKGDPGTDGTDGTDGVSPEVTITSITGGHTVKITDADHPTGQSFNVMNGTDGTDGADGVSPEVTIETITGGHSVTITDADHPTGQTFNVMDGQDGVSPEVTITSITGGHTVKITDADHPSGQSFNVMDGANTDADDVTYDPTETFSSGSVGEALTTLNSEITQVTPGKALTRNCYIQNGRTDYFGRTIDIKNGVITITNTSTAGSARAGAYITGQQFVWDQNTNTNSTPTISNLLPISLLNSANTLYFSKIVSSGADPSGTPYIFFCKVVNNTVTKISMLAFGSNTNDGLFSYPLEIPSDATHFAIRIYFSSKADINKTIVFTFERVLNDLFLATRQSNLTAVKQYRVNEFFSYNELLYIVTQDIANGGIITIGTNAEQTTVGAQLTALLNA